MQPFYSRSAINIKKFQKSVFISLGIQHARRILNTSSVTCPALLYFSILPHQLNDFWKGKKLLKLNMFWFSLKYLSETFLILRRTVEIWSKIYISINVKYPLILSDFNKNWPLLGNFKKISWKYAKWELSNPMRTDMKQVIVAFHNFKNAHNYWINSDEIR